MVGVLAPRAGWRAAIVGDRAATGRGSADGPREEGATGANPECGSTVEPPAPS
jgi:hypothetical protein